MLRLRDEFIESALESVACPDRKMRQQPGIASPAAGRDTQASMSQRIQLPIRRLHQYVQCKGQGSTNLIGYSIQFSDLPPPQ
jgi:hypothetical protein